MEKDLKLLFIVSILGMVGICLNLPAAEVTVMPEVLHEIGGVDSVQSVFFCYERRGTCS